MAGYQYNHIETYARIPGRSGKKQSARGVVNEAERVPGACPHVDDPKPYKHLFGCTPSAAVRLAEERAAIATDSRGRKLRKDAQILLAGVASYPVPTSELTPHDPGLKKWLDLNHKYLLQKYAGDYKSCILHYDEEYIHIHYYVVPSIDKSGRLNIGSVHQGVKARDEIGGKEAKLKMRAYKEAMREFQEEYYEMVGRPSGLTKEGPGRRRLTRQEWKIEKAVAKRLADNIEYINGRNKDLELAAEELEKQKAESEAEIENKRIEANKKAATARDLIGIARDKEEKLAIKEDKGIIAYWRNKAKALIKKVASLEFLNKGLTEDVAKLEKANLELVRQNNELRYQNNLRADGISDLKRELNSVLAMASLGRYEEIEKCYNQNRGTSYEYR